MEEHRRPYDLKPISPEEAIESFLQEREDEDKYKTLRSKRHRLNSFLQWCRENDIDNMNDIDSRKLNLEYRPWRKEGEGSGLQELASITLKHHMYTLKKFLEFCADIDAVEPGLGEKLRIPELDPDDEVRDEALHTSEARDIYDWLNKYSYASRDHAIFTILWVTGCRLGGLRALDVDDLNAEDRWLHFVHRPDEERRHGTHTPLKNDDRSTRYVSIYPEVRNIIQDYIEHNRHNVVDERGRKPLITSQHGRLADTGIRQTCYRLTHPCVIDGCPHDKDPSTCEWRNYTQYSGCPSSRSPHAIRKGSISAQLNGNVHRSQPEEAPVEVVSSRSDVGTETLKKHYDVRDEVSKMEVRREFYE